MIDKRYIKALAGVSWLEAGADRDITYYFDDNFGVAWSAAAKSAFALALQSWEHVTNITFREVTSADQADMVERLASKSYMDLQYGWGTLGFHDSHEANKQEVGLFAAVDYDPLPGTVAFQTFVHELGHSLGLAHPHDTAQGTIRFPDVYKPTDRGPFQLNQDIFTVMSYNHFVDWWGVAAPCYLDILAIQSMYGANRAHNTGNTSYDLAQVSGDNRKFVCIWDAGGIDTIKFSGQGSYRIDLRTNGIGNDEFLSSAPGGYDPNGPGGGFTIASGVIIENAVGGHGDGEIYGNSTNNNLRGNNGYDFISGELGNDTLIGGRGNDSLAGGAGRDFMTGGAGADDFTYDNIRESGIKAATRDVITDFQRNADKINLFYIDAKPSTKADDPFVFILSSEFHHVSGELRYFTFAGHTYIAADVNGDAKPDMQIELLGLKALTKTDFIL
jgi:serralysin